MLNRPMLPSLYAVLAVNVAVKKSLRAMLPPDRSLSRHTYEDSQLVALTGIELYSALSVAVGWCQLIALHVPLKDDEQETNHGAYRRGETALNVIEREPKQQRREAPRDPCGRPPSPSRVTWQARRPPLDLTTERRPRRESGVQ